MMTLILCILLAVALIVAVVLAVIAIVTGGAVLAVFGDLIIFVLIIVLLKKLFGRKK